MDRERRRSFGVGGAGNIRNIKEATVEAILSTGDAPRRRSSVWSTSSSTTGTQRTKAFFDGVKNIFGSSPKESGEESP